MITNNVKRYIEKVRNIRGKVTSAFQSVLTKTDVSGILSESPRGDLRVLLSKQYIKGSGLEIGALYLPLFVSEGVTVTYVDLFSREESIAKYPELNAAEIVPIDHIDDGFVLSTIPEASQDFLIANHVLEHTPNPIQVLLNWVRVLKPNGVLFVTVPILDMCFDKGRALTPLQHLIDDFNLYKRQDQAQINERNKGHLIEWVTISEPAILSEREADYVPLSPSKLQQRIDGEDLENLDIHFHTFSLDSVKSLIHFFTTELDDSLKVEVVRASETEIITVLRKEHTLHSSAR